MWKVEPRLWRHPAAAAQTADPLHDEEALARIAAARWPQVQGLELHGFPIPHQTLLSVVDVQVP